MIFIAWQKKFVILKFWFFIQGFNMPSYTKIQAKLHENPSISPQEHYQKLNKKMDEQDQKLDKLLELLVKIENIGIDIRDELDRQSDLLNHIDHKITGTIHDVKKNTRTVARIDHDTRGCSIM